MYSLTIRNDADNAKAGDLARRVTTARKNGETLLAHLLQPVKEAKARLDGVFLPEIAKMKNGEIAVKDKIAAYLQEQSRIRMEAARKEGEERERIAAEHRRKAAEADNQKERERLEALADKQDEKRENIIVPSYAPPAKVAGIATYETWNAEVTDLRELVQAWLDGRVPDDVIEPNMVALNRIAKALKGATKLPGVKAVSETTVSARKV